MEHLTNLEFWVAYEQQESALRYANAMYARERAQRAREDRVAAGYYHRTACELQEQAARNSAMVRRELNIE